MRRVTPCALLLAVPLLASLAAHAQPGTHGQAPAPAPSPAPTEGRKLKALLDAFWEETLQRNPLQATAIGDDRFNDRFPNTLTPAWRAEEKALTEKWLKAFEALDRSKLTGQDLLSRDILVRDLKEGLEGLRFPSHLIPLNQAGSLATFFGQLGSGQGFQPFRTAKDYADWLKRADGIIAWMDQAAVNLREGMAKGVVQPKVAMVKVVPQLSALIAEVPEQSVFWGPVAALPKTGLPAAEQARIAAEYRAAIAERINPAYRRLRDFIQKEYLPACRDSVGYGALPDGQAWYAFRVKAMTTTDLTPDAIHEMGQREVKRILGEMEAVRKQVGFKGDLPAFFRHLDSDPQFYFTKAEDLLAGYRELQKKIDGLLPKLFDVFPKANYEVRAVEAFRAESAAGGSYEAGSPDGKRPGIFYCNTFNLKAQPKFGMETLSLHEASPGHHFQISIAQEVEGLPMFRRFGGYVAYQEGWALYAESLGKELGVFTDPYQWYGRLADEQLRAMRLVVDTGLHSKGWTREQAIRFMRENSSMAESDVVSEVERYIVWPGQALGYKLGQFAIRDLRTEAEAALGKKFDVKAFHRQVLIDGALPLDVLKTKIRAWIAAEKAKG
ncbi:MAG TPA: DUF885 domain-containing protein [Holophagaceae bacterium]|nr:DUF885 domain-containing protein [Holophagaceae bacterium]